MGRPLNRVRYAGIVGAGTMGGGIALAFAQAGIRVTLVDAEAAALGRASEKMRSLLQTAVDRGRMEPGARDAALESIAFSGDMHALAPVDVAVEAVYEDLELKRSIFERLGSICSATALLSTNTSTLDIDAIAERASGPQRIFGLHFFSPAHIMKLVEIVRGSHTSAETLQRGRALVGQLGKIGIVVGNGDGFVGNRMLLRYRREAELLLEEGATPQQVDAALQRFGFAMGPFAVSDLAGLDIAYAAKQERNKRGGLPFRQSRIPDRLVLAGRLGQKTGAGYYRYEDGNRTPRSDPLVDDIILAERHALGTAPRRIDNAEIVERTLLALYAEAQRILAAGVAGSADDVDAIWRYGYGFPAAIGGPIAYARSLDPAVLSETLERFAKRDPAFWTLPKAALTSP